MSPHPRATPPPPEARPPTFAELEARYPAFAADLLAWCARALADIDAKRASPPPEPSPPPGAPASAPARPRASAPTAGGDRRAATQPS